MLRTALSPIGQARPPPEVAAAAAGLRAGDVITKIDGEPATSNVQLQELTLTKSPATRVVIGGR